MAGKRTIETHRRHNTCSYNRKYESQLRPAVYLLLLGVWLDSGSQAKTAAFPTGTDVAVRGQYFLRFEKKLEFEERAEVCVFRLHSAALECAHLTRPKFF